MKEKSWWSMILLGLLTATSSAGQFNPYRDICGGLCSCQNQVLNCTCWWGTRTNFIITGDIRAKNFHTVRVENCGKVELDLVNPTYGIYDDLIFQTIRRFIFRNLTELSIYPQSLESSSLEELTIEDVVLVGDNASIVNNASKPHHVQRIILRNVTSGLLRPYFLNITSLEALILDACRFNYVDTLAFNVGRLTSLLITNSIFGEIQERAIEVDSHLSDVTIKKSYLEHSSAHSFSFKSVTRLMIKDNQFEDMTTGSISAPLGISLFRFTGNRITSADTNPFWPFFVSDSIEFSRNYFGAAKPSILPSPLPEIVLLESNMFGNCDRQAAIQLRHLSQPLYNSSFCLFADGTTVSMIDFFDDEVQMEETSTLQPQTLVEDVVLLVETNSTATRPCVWTLLAYLCTGINVFRLS